MQYCLLCFYDLGWPLGACNPLAICEVCNKKYWTNETGLAFMERFYFWWDPIHTLIEKTIGGDRKWSSDKSRGGNPSFLFPRGLIELQVCWLMDGPCPGIDCVGSRGKKGSEKCCRFLYHLPLSRFQPLFPREWKNFWLRITLRILSFQSYPPPPLPAF